MSPDEPSRAEFFSGKRASTLLAEFDIDRTPRHVAIIMDGNGRWAAKRALPRLAGHRAGAKAVREAIAASIELGISYLTIYSFSSENWSRPKDEVVGLMSLFVEVLERELANLERMDVRVMVIGELGELPDADPRRLHALCRAHGRQRRSDLGGSTQLRRASRHCGSRAQDRRAGRLGRNVPTGHR